MKVVFHIPIICGETTCGTGSGMFCEYVGTRRLGTEWICRLFPTEEDSYTQLEDKESWLQRCKMCLETAREV